MTTAAQQTFLFVGAGLAGAKTAEALRADGFTGRIVLLGEETEHPYNRPPLSKDHLKVSRRRTKSTSTPSTGTPSTASSCGGGPR